MRVALLTRAVTAVVALSAVGALIFAGPAGAATGSAQASIGASGADTLTVGSLGTNVVRGPRAVPTASDITPTVGSTSGGTAITLTGTNFDGATSVTLGGNAATDVTVVNDTTITADTPPGATGAVDVVVTTPDGSTTLPDGYTYISGPSVGVPSVTSISPDSSIAGTAVTITGSNFTGATGVTFGGVPATNVSVFSDTTIFATAPAGAADADVQVTGPGGTSTTEALFTYVSDSPPTLSAVSPGSGSVTGGQLVTITGTALADVTGVMFGDSPATFITDQSGFDTQITATVPTAVDGPGPVGITVSTSGGTSISLPFIYLGPPTVTGVSPSSGPAAGGTTVTIKGSGFTDATAVDFGSTPATNVTVVSDTQITATAPPGSAGAVDVTVTTPDGPSATVGSDQFTYVPAPAVASVFPSSGPIAGGTSVTITGNHFIGTTAVAFGALRRRASRSSATRRSPPQRRQARLGRST